MGFPCQSLPFGGFGSLGCFHFIVEFFSLFYTPPFPFFFSDFLTQLSTRTVFKPVLLQDTHSTLLLWDPSTGVTSSVQTLFFSVWVLYHCAVCVILAINICVCYYRKYIDAFSYLLNLIFNV